MRKGIQEMGDDRSRRFFEKKLKPKALRTYSAPHTDYTEKRGREDDYEAQTTEGTGRTSDYSSED